MKRFMTIVSVLAILAMGSSAYAATFGWTLSASPADPFANTATPSFGVANVYLWLFCGTGNGMASAEFDLGGTLNPLAFTTMNGFLNAGGAANLLLAVGGCPNDPSMVGGPAGFALIIDVGGNMCFQPSAANNLLTTVECGTLALSPMEFIGYASDGSVPCMVMAGSELCFQVSVEDGSWGSIKSLYR
jgi:hypothetical protein